MAEKQQGLNLIRLQEVTTRVGLSKPSIYRLMKLGMFPRSRKIGSRAVAWIDSEINDWIRNTEITRGV